MGVSLINPLIYSSYIWVGIILIYLLSYWTRYVAFAWVRAHCGYKSLLNEDCVTHQGHTVYIVENHRWVVLEMLCYFQPICFHSYTPPTPECWLFIWMPHGCSMTIITPRITSFCVIPKAGGRISGLFLCDLSSSEREMLPKGLCQSALHGIDQEWVILAGAGIRNEDAGKMCIRSF